MSPPPPRTMFDEYVLVDRKTYDRWATRDTRERNDTAAPRPSTPAATAVNPFQNPHVREAKRLRHEVGSLMRDKVDADGADGASVPVPGELDRAVEAARLLLQDYHREFDRASGRKNAPNPKRRQHDNGDALSLRSPTVRKDRPRSRSPIASSTPTPPDKYVTPRRSRAPSRPSTSTTPGRASASIASADPAPRAVAVDESVDHTSPPKSTTATSPTVKARRRVGRFDTLTDVSRAVGGYVTESDAKKMMPLLNALDEAGYVRTDGRLIDRVKVDGGGGDGGFFANRSDLRTYIRDVTINDPARRHKSVRDIDAFGRFLKREGIDFRIEPSTARASERPAKKKKPKATP